jgi:ubiquinone biosynthesis protein UbiJ
MSNRLGGWLVFSNSTNQAQSTEGRDELCHHTAVTHSSRPSLPSLPSLSPINFAAAKMVNRVLSDYPTARQRLAHHALARIDVHVGPVLASLRLTPHGTIEPVGEGAHERAQVTFRIPLARIPSLLRQDPSANRDVAFEGDSELAQVLSTVAHGIEWDIEEDLSRLLGRGKLADIVSHRVVGTAKSLRAWRDDAGQRFTENIAEYLIHEREAFIHHDELEQFARHNETLRDDVARLEARLATLNKNQQ